MMNIECDEGEEKRGRKRRELNEKEAEEKVEQLSLSYESFLLLWTLSHH